MPCTITQASLGAAFADVDPDQALIWIATATSIVLGAPACQAETEAKWSTMCCLDVCAAITLLAQHMIAVTPGSGGEAQLVASEKVGQVAASYVAAASSANLFEGSIYGRMYSVLLGQFESCQSTRRFMPGAIGGSCGGL